MRTTYGQLHRPATRTTHSCCALHRVSQLRAATQETYAESSRHAQLPAEGIRGSLQQANSNPVSSYSSAPTSHPPPQSPVASQTPARTLCRPYGSLVTAAWCTGLASRTRGAFRATSQALSGSGTKAAQVRAALYHWPGSPCGHNPKPCRQSAPRDEFAASAHSTGVPLKLKAPRALLTADHRGTPERPGRVVTLEENPDAITYGVAYELCGDEQQQLETLRVS